MTGLDHLSSTFSEAKSQKRAAFMPYFTLGFPTPEASLEIIQAISAAGADILELGIPFSDPLADGPTIQHSTQVALENGTTAARCLEMVAQLRLRGVAQPLVLMSYFNPILAAGVDNFIQAACQAGADGFIIPDLPPEEAGIMEAACQARQVALVYLAAPTSPPGRLASLAARTTGFLYLVSLTGVTGARAELQEGLEAFIQRARAQTRSPLAVGFGLSTPAQARTVGALADGVIVGSALIKAVEEAQNPGAAAGEFIHRFRLALEPERHTKM